MDGRRFSPRLERVKKELFFVSQEMQNRARRPRSHPECRWRKTKPTTHSFKWDDDCSGNPGLTTHEGWRRGGKTLLRQTDTHRSWLLTVPLAEQAWLLPPLSSLKGFKCQHSLDSCFRALSLVRWIEKKVSDWDHHRCCCLLISKLGQLGIQFKPLSSIFTHWLYFYVMPKWGKFEFNLLPLFLSYLFWEGNSSFIAMATATTLVGFKTLIKICLSVLDENQVVRTEEVKGRFQLSFSKFLSLHYANVTGVGSARYKHGSHLVAPLSFQPGQSCQVGLVANLWHFMKLILSKEKIQAGGNDVSWPPAFISVCRFLSQASQVVGHGPGQGCHQKAQSDQRKESAPKREP